MALTIECKLFRATHEGTLLDDITDGFLEGSVSFDVDRDVAWTFNATMTLEGFSRLRPLLDWVAPTLTVSYPDGTWRWGQLGLYLVMPSPEARQELTGTVELVAWDPLHLLSIQGFQRKLLVRAGTDKARAAKEVLDGAVLTEGAAGRPRYAIPRADNPFRRDREWPGKTSKLAAVNEILEAAGYYPLWTTSRGVITSRHRAVARLRERTPVALFAGHAPPGMSAPGVPRAPNPHANAALPNNIVGEVRRLPRGSDLSNEVLIVNDDPNPREGTGANGRIRVKHKLDNPRNRRTGYIDVLQSAHGERVKQARPRYLRIDDEATARQVAAALADELTARDETIRFSALPNPEPEYGRETVVVALWDAAWRNIAYGHFAVWSIEYGLTPTSALMSIEAGLIGSADPLIQIGSAA